jgi:hypothetical protein
LDEQAKQREPMLLGKSTKSIDCGGGFHQRLLISMGIEMAELMGGVNDYSKFIEMTLKSAFRPKQTID